MLGEAVLDRMCINVQQVSFGLESPPGLYVLELLDERGHFTLRKLNVGER
jgi:hypothetical protein